MQKAFEEKMATIAEEKLTVDDAIHRIRRDPDLQWIKA